MSTLEAVITAYAAIVATAVAFLQIRTYIRDRPRLKIFISRSTHGPGAHGGYAIADAQLDELVEVCIANPGRRPLKVVEAGARIDPGERWRLPVEPTLLEETGEVRIYFKPGDLKHEVARRGPAARLVGFYAIDSGSETHQVKVSEEDARWVLGP